MSPFNNRDIQDGQMCTAAVRPVLTTPAVCDCCCPEKAIGFSL